jgi:hypothetical protein
MERIEIEKWLLENRNIDGLSIKWHVDLLTDFLASQNTIHNSNYTKSCETCKSISCVGKYKNKPCKNWRNTYNFT